MALRRERVGAFVVISGLVFSSFALFKILGVETRDAVMEPIRLQRTLLSDGGLDIASLIARSVINILHFATPLIPAVFAMSVAGVYGIYYSRDKLIGPAAAAVGGIAGAAYAGISFTSASMVVGMVVAIVLTPRAAVPAYKQATKWKNYTATSKGAGRGLIVLNVFIALGVFLTVITSLPAYSDIYIQESQQTAQIFTDGPLTDEQLVERMPESVRQKYDDLSPDKQEEFLADYREIVQQGSTQTAADDEVVSQLVTAYLLATPFVVFGVLEVLRSLVLVHVAGAFGAPIMRRQQSLRR